MAEIVDVSRSKREEREKRQIFAEYMLQHLLSTIAGRLLTSSNKEATNDERVLQHLHH